MYERIRRLYTEGRLDLAGVRKAVPKLITEEQFFTLTGHVYSETEVTDGLETTTGEYREKTEEA